MQFCCYVGFKNYQGASFILSADIIMSNLLLYFVTSPAHFCTFFGAIHLRPTHIAR